MSDEQRCRLRQNRQRLSSARQFFVVATAFLVGFLLAVALRGPPVPVFLALLAVPAVAGMGVRPSRRVALTVAIVAMICYGVYFCIVASGYDGPRVSPERFDAGAFYAAIQYPAVVLAGAGSSRRNPSQRVTQ